MMYNCMAVIMGILAVACGNASGRAYHSHPAHVERTGLILSVAIMTMAVIAGRMGAY